MRQAGRYLPEYRDLRGDRDILEACREPELVVELTLQPLRRMDVDAAILFSDIMVPLAAVGFDLRIDPGLGPVVGSPIRSSGDLRLLRRLEPDEDVPYVLEAIRLLRKELHVPLIGFAGGPFTLASYLVEGGPSRDHERTKALMLGDLTTWLSLMERLTGLVLDHLSAQVRAGAQAIQVFDSGSGNALLLGAVGSLQFEIVVQRLQSEYKVDAVYDMTNIFAARWLTFPDDGAPRL